MSIEIEQLTLRCRVPGELGGDANRGRAFLDRLLESVKSGLATALSRAFADSEADERIVFIETVHFELAVNLDRPPEEIAKRIAGRLARTLWAALSDPNTARFRDTGELWARFFVDLASGAAYTRPWHREFAGLRPLSTSGILRSLIEAEPRVASAALCRLTPADLARVLSHLSVADAHRALHALTASTIEPCHDPEPIATALASLSHWRPDDPKSQLALTVVMERELGLHADAITFQLADLLLQLAGAAGDPSDPASMDAALTEYLDSLAHRSSMHSSMAARLRDYLTKCGPTVPSALQTLRKTAHPRQGHFGEVRLGGFWLLLPLVLEQLDMVEGLSALPDHQSGSRAESVLAIAFAATALSSGPAVDELWTHRSLRAALEITQKDEDLWSLVNRALTAHDACYAAPDGRPSGTGPGCNRPIPSPVAAQTPTPSPASAHAHPPGPQRPFSTRRADLVELQRTVELLGRVSTRQGNQRPRGHQPTRALARIAYRALRAYARRLPGFSPSSNAHLWKNFLATPATIWCEANSIRVVLDAPPLDVIWRITGAGRTSYLLPDGRTVAVDVRR